MAGRRLPQYIKYRAPSWPWASVVGMAIGHTLDKNSRYKHYAHVVDAHVITSGRDLTGKVSGGQLTLSCTCMLSGKLYQSEANNYGVKLKRSRRV